MEFSSSFFVIKSITYIHLTAEYKLPILSLQQLNTIDLILSRKYKIKFYNDLFSAHSQHERSIGDVAPGTIQREMRQIIAWYAPTPTFARAGSRGGGGERICEAAATVKLLSSLS